VNVAGHNSDLAFAWRDHARTIRTNKPSRAITQVIEGTNHIERRYALGYANGQRQRRVRRFHDRISSERRRNIDHACVGSCLLDRFGNRVKNRNAFVLCAALAWRSPCDYLRAVSDHLSGVKGAFLACDPLDDNPSASVDEYAQALLPM